MLLNIKKKLQYKFKCCLSLSHGFASFCMVSNTSIVPDLQIFISPNYFSTHSTKMPSSAAQEAKSCITIKGSAEIVCEYLNFGINSILFQRGIYPPEHFKTVENYGLSILMSEEPKIKEFLSITLNQLKEWLVNKIIDKVSLVIADVNTKEPLERWDFKVEYCGEKNKDGKVESDKPLKQIQKEIRDVMKQIASSVAYLPLLDTRCSIDLLMYTNKNETLDIPSCWEEAASADIKNAQTVALRSFSTNIHRVNTAVVYKSDD